MPGSDDKTLLRLRDVTVRFGGVVALDGISFDVDDNGVCGLIGPNGAGKSTLFNCLSRLYECEGSIHFDESSLLDLPRHRIAAIGIGRTFQNLALFPSMSVRENVLTGSHVRGHTSFFGDALRLRATVRREREVRDKADELIDFLDLSEVADRLVAELPFGTKKRVELARALAGEPRLLLLDEPACGLNHAEVDELGRLIRELCERRNLAVLLVEHHMGLVMSVSDKVVALNFGKKIAEGTPEEVRGHPEVLRAYLGENVGDANAGAS